ncbi:MAG: pentapeptide repeat-containing protein [Beijerinckiaceae bacterium]
MTDRWFRMDVSGAFLRRTDLSHATLKGANLSRADFTGAILRGADLDGALLNGTILRGADLTDAKNLTVEQLRQAVIDEATRLPSYLTHTDVKAAA